MKKETGNADFCEDRSQDGATPQHRLIVMRVPPDPLRIGLHLMIC